MPQMIGLVALPHHHLPSGGRRDAKPRGDEAGACAGKIVTAGDPFLSVVMHILPFGFAPLSMCLVAGLVLSEFLQETFLVIENSTLKGSRGRGKSILISDFTVPGCGVMMITRSAR